jgi:hypothetical protein
MSSSAYQTTVFIGLLCVMCSAVVLLTRHCVLVACCCNHGRRRRRQPHQPEEQEEASYSVDMSSSSSRVHLVKGAAVVWPYRKESGSWSESTCPVCLADFADDEPVRVLPECMHYFHADFMDTWLRGSTSCPMCRAETTPTPSPSGDLRHHHDNLSVSVSLEEILVRT